MRSLERISQRPRPNYKSSSMVTSPSLLPWLISPRASLRPSLKKMAAVVIYYRSHATQASLCVVMILLCVTFREVRGFLTVLASLFLGVSIMLGIAAAFGMHLNFLNFVAIPITFGIASEYGVNIYERGRHTSISELPEAV